MLQVFRIEHKDTHVGPFQTPGDFTQSLAAKASRRGSLKSPCQDGLALGLIPFSFVFGCPDLQSLKRWFLLGSSAPENACIVQELEKEGFVLAEFLVEAEDCRMSFSRIQVAFDAEACREESLVAYHPLSALLTKGTLIH